MSIIVSKTYLLHYFLEYNFHRRPVFSRRHLVRETSASYTAYNYC